MNYSVDEIIKRHRLARAKKELFRDLYEDAYEFCLPQRNLYGGEYEGRSPGQKKMARVFDSTAINSIQRFANRMQSGIFPPQRKWCRLEPGPEIPEDQRYQAQVVLDQYTEKMFAALKQSNFDMVIGEFLLDLSIGTAVMMVQPGTDDNPISFTPVPQFLVSYEEGANGTVDNVYRMMRVKGEAVAQQWKGAKIPSDLARMIEDKPTEDIDFTEATLFNYRRGEYHYCVVHEKSKSKIYERTLKTSPWVISRYMKVAGEIYGRGPAITALPDIKTLNKTLELLLKNASLAISGVYTAADDGVLNPQTVRIVPGAVIPVARNGGPQGESLKALPRAGDFNVSQIVINDLRQNIKRTLLDESLPPDNMSARSATEVVERMKELSQNLGSAFGRLINETMIPLVSKMLEVMDEKGLLVMPLKVNGMQIRVAPVAPLAMAQNMEEIQNIMQFKQIAETFGQEGAMALNNGETVDYIGDKLGVPATLRTSAVERQQMMASQAQAAAAMAEFQGQIPQGSTQAVEQATGEMDMGAA